MTNLRNAFVVAGLAAVALVRTGAARLTDAETRCQRVVNAANGRFVTAAMKGAARCVASARKGASSFADCVPPYGGAMRRCVGTLETERTGAENRFARAIRAKCDPTVASGRDCPECWSGGDCSPTGEAGNRVQRLANVADTLVPEIFCEQPGADAAETACELTTAKALSKLAGALGRCFDGCVASERRGAVPTGACALPVDDPATAACIRAAGDKSIRAIRAKCDDVGARPDCFAADDYPRAVDWTNFVELYVGGAVPETFCDSPSAAFLE